MPSQSEVPLVCPKATTPTKKRLSPHDEIDEEEGGSESDSIGLPIGMRGHRRSLETPPATSEASVGEDGDAGSDEQSQVTCEEDRQEIEDLPDKDYDVDGYHFSVVKGRVEEDAPDFELTDVLASLGDVLACAFEESESSGLRYIGVMEDRELDLATVPKIKRALSRNALAVLNSEDGRSNEKPKRAKRVVLKEWAPVATTLLSTFNLGPPALQNSSSSLLLQKIRFDSPVLMSSDDEDLDRQLGEELDGQYEGGEDRNETPVPLLTPPGSPLTVEWEGHTTTMCEWPSNLTVDSAMQAANELRPMSPTSLENLERDEQDRVEAMAVSRKEETGSSLTPLLRSIYVGDVWG